MAKNRTIGINGGLPWNISEDLRLFKTVTMGHPIIMGRKSWESPDMPKPLPDCKNIVVTETPIANSAGSLLRPIRTLAEINNPIVKSKFNARINPNIKST